MDLIASGITSVSPDYRAWSVSQWQEDIRITRPYKIELFRVDTFLSDGGFLLGRWDFLANFRVL